MNKKVPAQTPASERRFPVKSVAAVGAVAVVALLLGAIMLPSAPGAGTWFGPESADGRRAATASQSIEALGSLDDVAGPAVADAHDQVAALEGEITAAMDAALATGTSTIDAAIASADVEQTVALLTGPAYVVLGPVDPMMVPELPSIPSLPTPSISGWVPMPTDLVPRDGVGGLPLDGLGDTGELGGLGELGDLGGLGLPVDDLGLGDLGLGDPIAQLDGLLGGLPLAVPGLGGSDPTSSAYDAAQPDENGAATAKGHATMFLGAASDSYGDALATADDALASLDGLVADTQASVGAIESAVAEAQSSVPADLQARLSATTQAAAEQSAGLLADAAAASSALSSAQADATAHITAVADGLHDQVADVEATATASFDAAVEDVYAAADAHTTAVRQQAEGALDGLSGARAQSVIDSALATTASIEAHAEAQVASLEAARSQVEASLADATATIEGLQASALASVTDQVSAATTSLDSLVVAGSAAIDSHLEYTLAAHERVATAALDDLSMEAQHRTDAIIATATSHAEAAFDFAGRLQDLTGGVVTDAGTGLSTDLDYILKVAGDYGQVPAPDRQAKASFWNDIHGQLSVGWGLLSQAGSQVDAAADDVSAEASGVLGALGSLTV